MEARLMQFNKEYLEKLAEEMSVGEMAEHLGMAKSTLYYNMRKLGVKRRSRSEAQKLHIKKSGHQRTGSQHSNVVRDKISHTARQFWDSSQGKKQKKKLGELRRQEWKKSTVRQRRTKMSQLQHAAKPKAGDLSRFGVALAQFLTEKGYKVSCGIALTPDHVSDIILEAERVVIELVPPVAVYGIEAQTKFNKRYRQITDELNALKYKVLIVEQVSNSISRARCERVYEEFTNLKSQVKTIQS